MDRPADLTGHPIHPDEFSERLVHDLAFASEQGARGLHVQVTVPPTSAYRWVDGAGDEHLVHLPTRLKTAVMRFPGEPNEDGGPAAVFRIDAFGQVPPISVTTGMAEELLRECIRWGRVRHAAWHGGVGDELPDLPFEFEDIVQTAIFMDVS